MNKQAPNVEWYITESDAAWERLQGPPRPDHESPAPCRRRLQRYLWSMAALFLLLVSAGDWWWRTTQAYPVEVAVTATEQPEPGVVHQDDRSTTSDPGDQRDRDGWDQQQREASGLRAAVQTADPKAHLDIELHTVEFQGDQAVTRVVTTAHPGAPAYRQTRFYRRTSTGWLRTEPDAALWGLERSLETPSFIFHFHQNDAPAVIAVAPQIEALYTTLRRNVGLPLTSSAEKLVIEVNVTQPPGQVTPWYVVPDRFIVPSPAVYWAPVELTAADLLAQSIALSLLNYVLAQASERHQIDSAWQPLWRSLRLWQVWDLDLPLSIWREEVVKWIYLDLPATRSGQAVVLPSRYAALCAAHTLWMPYPAEIDIPLVCEEADLKDGYFSMWSLRDPPVRLDQITKPISYSNPSLVIYHRGQTIAGVTVIEYAVATYGREHLPALVAGLSQYESWETLIPAVYGISATEFEIGWQAYLTAHYGAVSAD